MRVLASAPEKRMKLAQIMRECEKEKRFWRDFGAAKAHIVKMMTAGLVDLKKDEDGEYVVALKKEVALYVEDVE